MHQMIPVNDSLDNNKGLAGDFSPSSGTHSWSWWIISIKQSKFHFLFTGATDH